MPDPLKLPISSVPPETVVAIAWMVVASFVAVTTHGMIRHVGTTGMHPFQITFFYNLFTIAIIVPLVVRGGTGILRTRLATSIAKKARERIMAAISQLTAEDIARRHAPASPLGCPGFEVAIDSTLR